MDYFLSGTTNNGQPFAIGGFQLKMQMSLVDQWDLQVHCIFQI